MNELKNIIMEIDKKAEYEIPNYFADEYDKNRINKASGELIEQVMGNYFAIINNNTGFVKMEHCAFLGEDSFTTFMREWQHPQDKLRKQLLDAQNLIFKISELTKGK